jgi:hypothetical protein
MPGSPRHAAKWDDELARLQGAIGKGAKFRCYQAMERASDVERDPL